LCFCRREERYCTDPRGCPPHYEHRDEADFKKQAKKKRGEMKTDNGKEERSLNEKSKKRGDDKRKNDGEGGSSGEWFERYGEGRSKQRKEHHRSDWLFERAKHRQAS
jgi:hypothetical protein